ncbi:circadian clock KaiB family protein [Larkinella rosea]|uniref:Circadian clock protein KaiB n=1 Tax=Larkinella rosea TaxID=2025312 RepID=A0A3P1BIA6_9BACT|nr:circadian clock KaiB family protein [Larkinella rosea]RRB00827.1 circadian clock protein KaiB [Larkinella rosea]
MIEPVTLSDLESNDEPAYELRLFVTGASINSIRAIANLKHICDMYIPGRYSLEIIDVYQQKALAESEQIIALPLLIKKLPMPQRRLIGDMSDTAKVLKGLGISTGSE